MFNGIMNRYTSLVALGITAMLFLWLIKAFNISYPISVTTRNVSGELSVVGEGKVDVVPDTATVQVGIVVSDARTVQEAQSGINEANNKIVAAVTKLGIDKKDIKTSDYSINPNYNYESGQNPITGYSGNATLSIKVKKTDILPQVIQAATGAGANQVYNTQYSIDDPAKYRERARNEAIKNAREQAQKLAAQLGIRLGKVVNIVESNAGSAPGFMYKEAALDARGGGAAPNLQPGTQTINSTVTLFFEKN